MDQLQTAVKPEDIFQSAAQSFGGHDWAQAEALCRQVLRADPRHAATLHMLALIFNATGRKADAIAKLAEAIELEPNSAGQWANLGKLYCDTAQFDDAVKCLREAIRLRNNCPEAHHNLSLAFCGLGQVAQAIVAAHRATELRPDYAKAHYHLANLLREEGRLEEAVGHYETTLRLRPDWPNAHFFFGIACYDLGQTAQALEHFQEAVRLDPASSAAEHAAGHALAALGRIEEAKAAYARAAGADAMSVLARESLAEVVAPDCAAIVKYHARVTIAVRDFASAASRKLDLSNLHADGAMPSMTLAYYGGDVRPIKEQYAQAIAPHIPRSRLGPRKGKPKLGVVVTKSHEAVFARLWGGIVEGLSRQSLDIRLVCSRAGANILQTTLKIPRGEYLYLPRSVVDAAQLLHEHEFDWLHYWEIGTDQTNYYLPFFQAAPGQSTCRGWPVTSGIPYVTSYLSSEQVEPPAGAAHYSEQLILLKQLPTYYVRPAIPSGSRRSRFGLDEGQHIYLCSQNLRKYHPDFDPALADVLRSDPLGLLLILADPQPSITELLLRRFQRTMPDVVSRVRVMPRMKREEYLALVAAADVFLDTFHYGGDTTAYDAVAAGTSIVTLPDQFHRSRWGAAINRRLGVPQLIASTPQEYVAKAVEVATNAELRNELRTQILAAGGELFEDMSVVKEHDAYFSEAIAATRAG